MICQMVCVRYEMTIVICERVISILDIDGCAFDTVESGAG